MSLRGFSLRTATQTNLHFIQTLKRTGSTGTSLQLNRKYTRKWLDDHGLSIRSDACVCVCVSAGCLGGVVLWKRRPFSPVWRTAGPVALCCPSVTVNTQLISAPRRPERGIWSARVQVFMGNNTTWTSSVTSQSCSSGSHLSFFFFALSCWRPSPGPGALEPV